MYKSRITTSNSSRMSSSTRAGHGVKRNNTPFSTVSTFYGQQKSRGAVDESDQYKKTMEGSFEFQDDDITDSMTAEDFQRLEKEAWIKVEGFEKDLSCGNDGTNTNPPPNPTALTNTRSNPHEVTSRGVCNQPIPRNSMPKQEILERSEGQQQIKMQKLVNQLEQYKLKVETLENNLLMKDSELQVVRNNLDARRRESNEKDNVIARIRKQQEDERSERNCKLAQEVKTLKTQLSFQKHETMKLETLRIQSQKVSNSQNVCNNYQKVPSSQKFSGAQNFSQSVKRKAEIPSANRGFDLDNSFEDSQASCAKIPQGKVPRLELKKSNHDREETSRKQPKSPPISTSKPAKNKKVKTTEIKPLCLSKNDKTSLEKPSIDNDMISVKPKKKTLNETVEKKASQLVKNLVLSHASDSWNNCGILDFETISLLNSLKYPLKHLPAVLKAHSVDANLDQSLSQFTVWQTQMQSASSENDGPSSEGELDFESGKYNLVSQGIFLLLGLSNSLEKNVNTLGVIHVLVFLELYVTSYIYLKRKNSEQGCKAMVDCTWTCDEGDSTSGEDILECQSGKASFDEHDMILQTLQILNQLLHYTPGLVECILDRTNPSVFRNHDKDVIVIYDSDEDWSKGDGKKIKEESTEGNVGGSFQSLLLKNLITLITTCQDQGNNSSLSVCDAALEVLIAMTSSCTKTQLERIFIPVNNGCLVQLLAKDYCNTFTVSRVMSLLQNFLPCKNVQSMLCSCTDDCILLKIYQCACEEEDYYGSEKNWRTFLLQFFELLNKIALSHSDLIELLLESDCQCSCEIVRCLVLVLNDRVKYLLDLDVEQIIQDESLSIVRAGINILVTLCTHACYSSEHKLDVEHEFLELINKSMNLFKNIRTHMPELEALALQDLLDMEGVYEIEWFSGSETEDNGRDQDEVMVLN